MPKGNSKGQAVKSSGGAAKKAPSSKPVAKTAAASRAKRVVEKKRPASSPKGALTQTAGTSDEPRRLKTPDRHWYNPLTWRNHPPIPAYAPLPKARVLFTTVLRELWAHKKLFGGIVATYGVLNILLVRGLAGSNNLATIKSTLDSAVHGFGGKLASSGVGFAYLLTSSGSGNTATSGIYQSVLLVVCSLAFIWALRQTLAGHVVRMRDSFYLGMYPLVPFLLLFLLAGVQLIPLAIGGGLYSVVISNGIAVHAWEKAAWLALFIGLALWSLRMLTATVFALYIVTLPDMAPLRAYRSAKKLVFGRRLLLWRKLIFLPVVLLLLAGLVELPLILYVTPLAEWSFFILSMVALPVTHSYIYRLYREML